MAGIDQLVVVEIAGSAAGAWAARLFAGAGARVIKVVPPGEVGAATDAAAYFDTAKTVVAATGAELEALVVGADVLVESAADGPLGPTVAPGDHPHLIRVRISPFGTEGPHAGWRSSDLVIQAAGGYVYLSGQPGRVPLQGPRGQADLAAGGFGAIGALAALFSRRRTGAGQTVEVSVQDTLAALHQFTELRYTHAGNILMRMGNRYAGPGSPIGMYPTADGQMALTVATAAHMEVLLAVTGLEHLLERPDVDSIIDVMVNDHIVVPPLLEWLSTRTTAEVVELFQAVRLAAGPVLDMHQLLGDEHLRARGFWQPMEVDGRAVEIPGAPFHIEGRPWISTAPTPGTAADVAAVADAAPAAGGEGTAAPMATELAFAGHPAAGGDADALPLDGLRVLDLTRVWAGPLACRILSDLGADVVMVEAPWQRMPRFVPDSYALSTHFMPDDVVGAHPWNRNGFINKYALGKRSVGVDMAVAEGRAVFEELVAAVDVVVENFSPRVMPNFGLGEDRLRELNPALIYLTMPGYGRDGPAADYSAYGPVLDSHAGLSTLMGYEGMTAWKCGIAWPDPVGGIHGAVAALLALWDRDADPDHGGRTIELAQFETAVAMIGDRLVEAQLTGTLPPLPGNRHPDHAPQGVYPSAGDDRWLALTVPDDDTWARLCALAGLPAHWAGLGASERRARHDELDAALSTWTATRDHLELADELQAAGVPAAAVLDGGELVEDRHLGARAMFVELTHPEAGTHRWPRSPALLSAADTAPTGPAPLLGQHNAEVLTAWAGLGADELAALEASGVVATEPPE